MLAILLEHDNLRSARRAVLISSFATLVLPQVVVSGDGLKILGLTIQMSQADLFRSSWLVTVYFFVIFLGFVSARIINSTKDRLLSRYNRILDNSLAAAKEIDEVIGMHPDHEDEYNEDFDGWWKEHFNLKQTVKSKEEKTVLY
ncbi:hypothetical protein [Aliiroseovarius sp. 2305UL8-7]|uniref:hypothetical protein n=1 Tax=Aliiroseovarius conchicola TaxID=3121637 RepID=UPI003528B070